MTVCPAAVAEVEPGVVWARLLDVERYPEWADVRLVSAEPPGPLAPGQRLRFTSRELGRDWPVVFEIHEVDSLRHRLGVDVRLPFGVVNHELITVAEAGPGRALVRFN
jgi:hypothetical protein